MRIFAPLGLIGGEVLVLEAQKNIICSWSISPSLLTLSTVSLWGLVWCVTSSRWGWPQVHLAGGHGTASPLGRSSLLTAKALHCCACGSLGKNTKLWASIIRKNSQTSPAATVAVEGPETSKTSVAAGEWVQVCGYVIVCNGVRWEDTGIDPAQTSWGARSRSVALAQCSNIFYLKENMTRSKIFTWLQFSQAVSSGQQSELTGTLFFRTPNLFWLLPTICILKAFKHYLWYHSLISPCSSSPSASKTLPLI